MQKVSENETVAEIVNEMRSKFPPKYCSSKSCRVEIDQQVRTFADRIESANKREVAAKDGERKGILKDNKSLAADNTRLRGEVAKLRECLKEAVKKQCKHKECKNNVCFFVEFGKENECIVHKWRKALEGEK